MTTTLTTAVDNSFTALVYTLPPQWVVENKKLVLSEQSLWTWNCFCFFPQYLFLVMLFLSLRNWTLCVCFSFNEPEHFLHCICCLLCSFLVSPFFFFSFFFHSFCCLLCCCFVSASLTYWAPQSCAGKSPFHLESRCPESRSCKETARVKTAFRVAENLMRYLNTNAISFVTVFVQCSPASSWWARRSHLSWSSVAGPSSIVCFRSV